MKIAATVIHRAGEHSATVRTENNQQVLDIPAKQSGPGSSVNGGELLFLALATCFCNDLYREAKERDIEVLSVQVEVTGRFGAKGASAEDIQYRVSVKANADRAEVLKLIQHTDSVAEIHNTVRKGTAVRLSECVVEEAPLK